MVAYTPLLFQVPLHVHPFNSIYPGLCYNGRGEHVQYHIQPTYAQTHGTHILAGNSKHVARV